MAPLLAGKKGIVLGIADRHSIAYAIARTFQEAGAHLVVTYQNERLEKNVRELMAPISVQGREPLLVQCDVTIDEQIEEMFRIVSEHFDGSIDFIVHSIAFANRSDMEGDFAPLSREGFQTAMNVSAYSIIPLVTHAVPLMKNGGSVMAMTFLASQKVFPRYNIMGVAKAALENAVMQLAAQYGVQGIRVNAISAGPLETLAARGIRGFKDIKAAYEERSPLGRSVTRQEVANMALVLCSDLSTGITGSTIYVDGGYNIMGI